MFPARSLSRSFGRLDTFPSAHRRDKKGNVMARTGLPRWWMTVSGLLMVGMGLLAMKDTSWVGTGPDAVLAVNAMHGAVHAAGGLIALAIGLSLRGRALANATLGYGLLMHLTVAVLSLLSGLLARGPALVPSNGPRRGAAAT
jgi:hypothetical protein